MARSSIAIPAGILPCASGQVKRQQSASFSGLALCPLWAYTWNPITPTMIFRLQVVARLFFFVSLFHCL
ncbi:MAG: hypothetical protein JXA42_23465 [Anaerolineales bacterium]|nr:hypothetical protein [Anaerolineales bacterium]